MVFDKAEKQYRKIRPKDICVLLRATTVLAPIYENEISNITKYCFYYFNNEEVLESEINEKLKSNNVVVRILGNEDKNKGSIIILKDKKINRCFEIEIISCCQINIIENSKKIETGLFIEDLENWIYNLYNPIEYLYEFVGGKLNNRILTREEINEISNELTKDYSEERKKGIAVHRKELDNQPTVEGYLGPMYNGIDYGKIILRYETQEVYDMLSD